MDLATSEITSRFGHNVRARRSELGVTQETVARITGVNRNYLGQIERGERNPTLASIVRIALALDTDPADLLTEVVPLRARERRPNHHRPARGL